MNHISSLIVIISVVSAVFCPNGCSGHGKCLLNGRCICYQQKGVGINSGDDTEYMWTGADCSKKICPKGKSFGAAILEGQEELFEISGTVYSATYVGNGYGRNGAPRNTICDSTGPAGCKYLLELDEYDGVFDNYYGGAVSCYDSDYKYVADFNIFHTGLYNPDGLRIGQLYGVQVSGSEDENKLDTIAYCKITGFRRDLSMFAFFNFDENDDFTKGVTVRGDLVSILTNLYNFPPTTRFVNNEVNMTCLNPTENENTERDPTVSRIYTVTVSKTTGDVNGILIKGNDKEDPTHTPIGKCSFLYSKQFGPIPLMSSDISAIVGPDGVAGRTEDGLVLWGGQTAPTPTPTTTPTEGGSDRRLLFTDDEGEDDVTGTDNSDEEVPEEEVRIDNVKPGETIIDETTITYVPPSLKIFKKLDPDAKIVTPTIQEIKQTVIKGATVEVMQFSECTKDNKGVRTCPGPMLKATATITSIDIGGSFKYTPEIMFTKPTDVTEEEVPTEAENPRRILEGESEKDFAFLVNSAGAHPQVECSGKGTCDRSSGVCKCDEGYQGSACQRRTCPNNCNGRGKCLPLSGITDPEKNDIYGQDIIYACKCDGGYRGSDCSLIECPSDKDPLSATNMDENSEYRDCSGRGKCDYTTGLCTCFGGYSGDACDRVQSTF